MNKAQPGSKAGKAGRQLEALQTRLAELEALLPHDSKLHKRGPRWTNEELRAFEARHKSVLPPGYRGFLEQIGDSGAGFTYYPLIGLREQSQASLRRLAKPFPLRKAWTDPLLHEDTLQEEGLFGEYKKLLYALPKGSSIEDGSLQIGHTSDHQAVRLVVTGPRADEIWYDNRGGDYGEVYPAKRTFLDLMLQWATDLVSSVKRRRKLEALCAERKLSKVSRTLGAKRLASLFEDLRLEYCDPVRGPLSPDVAVVMAAYYGKKKDPIHAGHALILGGSWQELLEQVEEALAKLETGPVTFASKKTKATLLIHLTIATAAVGRKPRRRKIGGYNRYKADPVPAALSRWPSTQLVLLWPALRPDIALRYLSRFPAPALKDKAGQVKSVLDGVETNPQALDRADICDAAEQLLKRTPRSGKAWTPVRKRLEALAE